MSKALLLLLFFLSGTVSYVWSQQYAFRIQFTDKQNTTFSPDQPTEYLSVRAVSRRAKYNTAIDSTDLPVVKKYTDSVCLIAGGILHNQSRWLNSCVILVTDTLQISRIRDLPFVHSVKQVAFYPSGLHAVARVEDNTGRTFNAGRPASFDEHFYGAAWQQIHLCNGAYLHEQGYMGADMQIAVIDVGFDETDHHPAFDSLRSSGRLVDTWNFIHATPDVFHGGSHGSQVLSCMAGYWPEIHVGTAPLADYALYATDDLYSEQAIEEDNLAAALERADSLGVDLINISLSYNTFDDSTSSYTYNDLDGRSTISARAANAAVKKGIVVVVSAGNEGANSWKHILTPGDADSVLTVGAVDNSGIPAASSGEGPNASGKLKPDVMGMGALASVISTGGSIIKSSGTSFAAPVIAGLVACLMEMRPEKNPMEIMSMVQQSAHLFNNPDYKNGYGIPDFRKIAESVSISPAQNKEEIQIQLYPNPAQNQIFIRYEGASRAYHTIRIYDCYGRVKMEDNGQYPMKKINIASLPQGIYFLKIEGDGNALVKSFIKQ